MGSAARVCEGGAKTIFKNLIFGAFYKTQLVIIMKKTKQTIKKFPILVFATAINIFSFIHLAKAEQCDGTDSTILCNPLKTASFTSLMESLSQLAVQIGIPIAALFIIYSGLKLVMARGNEESIKSAKTGLLWAIIGSGILIGAWTIMKILQSTVESL